MSLIYMISFINDLNNFFFLFGIKYLNILIIVKINLNSTKAIGWTIAGLKGISPSICMHYIYTEDNAKLIQEMQRWLNPNM